MTREIKCLADLALVENGVVDALFQQELRRAVGDLLDRPGLDKPRKVLVEMALSPEVAQDGTLRDINVSFYVQGKSPPSGVTGIQMGNSRGEGLVFNDLSTRDRRQRTLDEITQDKPEHGSKEKS